jgi:hypothetical protein
MSTTNLAPKTWGDIEVHDGHQRILLSRAQPSGKHWTWDFLRTSKGRHYIAPFSDVNEAVLEALKAISRGEAQWTGG